MFQAILFFSSNAILYFFNFLKFESGAGFVGFVALWLRPMFLCCARPMDRPGLSKLRARFRRGKGRVNTRSKFKSKVAYEDEDNEGNEEEQRPDYVDEDPEAMALKIEVTFAIIESDIPMFLNVLEWNLVLSQLGVKHCQTIYSSKFPPSKTRGVHDPLTWLRRWSLQGTASWTHASPQSWTHGVKSDGCPGRTFTQRLGEYSVHVGGRSQGWERAERGNVPVLRVEAKGIVCALRNLFSILFSNKTKTYQDLQLGVSQGVWVQKHSQRRCAPARKAFVGSLGRKGTSATGFLRQGCVSSIWGPEIYCPSSLLE